MENQIEKNKRTLVSIGDPELNYTCPLCESLADYFCSIGKKGRDYYKSEKKIVVSLCMKE